jgi:hypothetical protein
MAITKNFRRSLFENTAFYTPDEEPAINMWGKTTLVDSDGTEISIGGGSSGGGNNAYTTASGQYTATANVGTKTITITGLPFSLSLCSVADGGIKKIDASGNVSILDLTAISISGSVITLPNEDNFVTGDTVCVTLVGPDKAYDANQDVDKVNVENPLWDRYTDAESLVSASDIGATDDTWKDQGAEIDCRGYKTVGIWVNLTVNNSTGNQLQVLSKHTSAGSDEYILETASEYQKTLGNSDVKRYYEFGTTGIPYIQIQTKATDVDTGGGTEGTVSIDITKEY